MKKLKDKCEFCGKEFGFFSKKNTATKQNGRTYITFFLCDFCYQRYLMLPKQ